MLDVCNYLSDNADLKYVSRNLNSFILILIKPIFNNRGNNINIVVLSLI